MKVIILISLAIMGTSCQLLNKTDLKSDWPPLKSAGDVDCDRWPQRSQDLEVKTIAMAQTNDGPGFVTKVRTRRGLMEHHYRKFSRGDVDGDYKKLSWGSNANYLGSYLLEGKYYFVIETLSKSGRVIEIRDPKSNVIFKKSRTLSRNIRVERSYPSPRGIWLIYRDYVEDESMDERPLRIMELALGKGELLEGTILKSPAFSSDANVAMTDDNHLFVMWNKVNSRKKNEEFKFAIVKSPIEKSDVFSMTSDFKDKVESWIVARHRDGVLGVFISGDTLLWENASMEMKFFSDDGEQLWSKSFPIENEHVGDPLLVDQGSYSYLIVPKWLDGESTLSVTKVMNGEVQDLGYFGVFREGTFVAKSLSYKGSDEPQVITQFPVSYIKKFALCTVDL